jgi:hypothetical protein
MCLLKRFAPWYTMHSSLVPCSPNIGSPNLLQRAISSGFYLKGANVTLFLLLAWLKRGNSKEGFVCFWSSRSKKCNSFGASSIRTYQLPWSLSTEMLEVQQLFFTRYIETYNIATNYPNIFSILTNTWFFINYKRVCYLPPS